MIQFNYSIKLVAVADFRLTEVPCTTSTATVVGTASYIALGPLKLEELRASDLAVRLVLY